MLPQKQELRDKEARIGHPHRELLLSERTGCSSHSHKLLASPWDARPMHDIKENDCIATMWCSTAWSVTLCKNSIHKCLERSQVRGVVSSVTTLCTYIYYRYCVESQSGQGTQHISKWQSQLDSFHKCCTSVSTGIECIISPSKIFSATPQRHFMLDWRLWASWCLG